MSKKFDTDAFGEAIKDAIKAELGDFNPTPREMLMSCAAAVFAIARVFTENTLEDIAEMLSEEGQKEAIAHLREVAKEIAK